MAQVQASMIAEMSPHQPDSEDALEIATVERFRKMDYETANLCHETFGANSSHGREASAEVVFTFRLRKALKKLNPDLPAEAVESPIEQFTRDLAAAPADFRRSGRFGVGHPGAGKCGLNGPDAQLYTGADQLTAAVPHQAIR